MIKNIIFDLGGVFITLDPQRSLDAFEQMGAEKVHELYSTESTDPLIKEFEKGFTTVPELRVGLQQSMGLWVHDQAFDQAWNAMLGDFPKDRLDLLEKLSSKYTLLLLSNTNEIHYDACFKIRNRDPATQQLLDPFEREFYSHQMGMRKPDEVIYKAVLDNMGFNPAETLFVDDSLEHAEGALKVGLQSLYLEPPKTVLDIFTEDLSLKGKLLNR